MTKLALAVFAAVAFASLSPVASFAAAVSDSVNLPPLTNPGPRGDVSLAPGTDTCGSELGHLKQVFPAQIAGIKKGTKVWVTEICDSFAALRSEGNAEYLRPTIAKNKLLTGALFSKDYSAEDVFAVRMMGEGTINLYVHHFGR